MNVKMTGANPLGHSERLHAYNLPPEEVNTPTPFGCPNTYTIIRNKFFSPPSRINFLCWGPSFVERHIVRGHIMAII